MVLLLLAGCRTDCATFDETVILDPDGLLDEAGTEALYGAKDAFAAEVGVEGACVDRVEVAASLEEDGHSLGGFYRAESRLIVVSNAYAWDFGRILTHELCHALDEELGLSDTHPELFSDARGDQDLEEDLYSDVELRETERFAQLCEQGPQQPAITAALDELGLADPGDVFLRDWVYTGVEDVPVEIGPALGWSEPETLTLPDKGEVLWSAGATGGRMVARARGEGALPEHLLQIDPEGLAWGEELRLPIRRGRLSVLLGVGDTEPAFVTGWATTAPRLYRWSGGEVTAIEGPFAALAGDPDTSLTLDGDRAWWQTWGDGQPVQTGLLSTGEVEPYEASGELALVPPLARLPEGPVSFAYRSWPPSQEWYVFGEAEVSRLALPLGALPVGTLADGTVVAWTAWTPDDQTWCVTTVLRDPAGDWWLPGDAGCDTFEPVVLAGELYRYEGAGEGVSLSRATAW